MAARPPRATAPFPDREAIERAIVARHPVRLHLALILIATMAVGLISTRVLLALGIDSMLLRYPLALLAAWATFVTGVRLWLAYAGFGAIETPSMPGADLDAIGGMRSVGSSGGAPSGGGGGGRFGGGGGGGFGGAGATGDFAPHVPPARLLAGSSSGSNGRGSGIGRFDLGDDGWALLALIALVAAVLGAAGYLIYAAPDILADAAFALALGGGLARYRRTTPTGGWLRSVVRATLLPFAIVLALAVGFAAVAAHHFPEARTMRDVIHRL